MIFITELKMSILTCLKTLITDIVVFHHFSDFNALNIICIIIIAIVINVILINI